MTSAMPFITYYKEPFTSKKVILAINEFKLKTRYSLKWCPMDLRHSFAVNYLSKGGDITPNVGSLDKATLKYYLDGLLSK